MRLILVLATVAIAISGSAAGQEQPSLSQMIDRIKAVAHFHPAKYATEAEKAEIEALWEAARLGMVEYAAARPEPDYAAKLLLGEIYRLGYNMGKENSAVEAEKHLRSASQLRPLEPKPHYTLGRHYMSTKAYAEAELALLRAHVLTADGPNPDILATLAFSHYFQGSYELALLFAERVQAQLPDDQHTSFLIEQARSQLADRE